MLSVRRVWEVPEETMRVARAAFPRGNAYVRLRDELGPFYTDEEFASLFEWRGQPGASPGVLAIVTVMQFSEGLTDRQAAEAVAARIDWKYVLGLGLSETGFAHSVLSEFRQRLLDGGMEARLLESLLERLRRQGWLKSSRRQRTDSTHILAAIRTLNRTECMGETLRQALNDLAALAPEWLVQQVTPEWFALYGPRFESYRLPSDERERYALQLRMGADGDHLLRALYQAESQRGLWQLPSVQILRQVWVQQFYCQDDQVFVREDKRHGLPSSAQLIRSPYDPEARLRTKRATTWLGYSAHLSETCEETEPSFITQVTTTPATTGDAEVLAAIQADLDACDLAPEEQLVDTGYSGVEQLRHSRQRHEIDLVGPLPVNHSWQTQDPDAYALDAFTIDWEREVVTCPQDQESVGWHLRTTPKGTPVIQVNFARGVCLVCAARPHCTKRTTGARGLSFLPKERFLLLQQAHARQQTDAFWALYGLRAGIEATFSQAVTAFALRRTRYRGLAKTHFQNLAIAAAMNLARLAAWLDDPARAPTRSSRFAALAPNPV